MDMPKKHDLNNIRIVEAALFSAGRAVTYEELAKATGLKEGEVRRQVESLTSKYKDLAKKDATSLEIVKAGDKYVMQVRAKYASSGKYLAKMDVPERVLGTLALIAYHQPIKQSNLKDLIGQKVYDHVKQLYDLGLISADRDGRTKLLATSSFFPEYFGFETTDRKKIKNALLEKIKRQGNTSV
jgi:segregation and condensation protein B